MRRGSEGDIFLTKSSSRTTIQCVAYSVNRFSDHVLCGFLGQEVDWTICAKPARVYKKVDCASKIDSRVARTKRGMLHLAALVQVFFGQLCTRPMSGTRVSGFYVIGIEACGMRPGLGAQEGCDMPDPALSPGEVTQKIRDL